VSKYQEDFSPQNAHGIHGVFDRRSERLEESLAVSGIEGHFSGFWVIFETFVNACRFCGYAGHLVITHGQVRCHRELAK
jgi:hypothetical protein